MNGLGDGKPREATHIAGVGASAGGLDAMLPMFAGIPATGRIAYVVAQHMAKDGHDALVTRLIARESALPVVLAADGQVLLADTVYVIPSGRNGRVEDRRLSLQPPTAEHLSTPSVNTLFASLAESQRTRAIGIVLSGTGSDGTQGCRAILAGGGLTLAQDPQEAKFDGMPAAAIEGQAICRVLPVARIGGMLASLFSAPAGSAESPAPASESSEGAEDPRELDELVWQVHQATGIDFSSYKEDTLRRRLKKRKASLGIASAAEYQARIRRDPDELKTLQHLFLVSVSSFFRDRDSFAALTMSLARLVAGRKAGDPVRVWVPGCASGEEPLTIAILLRDLSGSLPVEIVGTDLNAEALGLAREGVYRQTAFREMEPALRDRWFVPRGQHYAVRPELAACVRYEQRDVLGGAPLDGLDLVSCRNLLIYMKSGLQDRLVKGFHQALRSQGLLFIGGAESLSFVGNSLFLAIDHYHRLFRRRQ